MPNLLRQIFCRHDWGAMPSKTFVNDDGSVIGVDYATTVKQCTKCKKVKMGCKDSG